MEVVLQVWRRKMVSFSPVKVRGLCATVDPDLSGHKESTCRSRSVFTRKPKVPLERHNHRKHQEYRTHPGISPISFMNHLVSLISNSN